MTVLSHLLFLLLATFLDFPFEDPCFLCSCGPFQNPEIRTRLLAQNQSTAHSFHHSNCVTLSMTSRMNFRAFFFLLFLEVLLKGLTLSCWSWNWKKMALKLVAILPPGRVKLKVRGRAIQPCRHPRALELAVPIICQWTSSSSLKLVWAVLLVT